MTWERKRLLIWGKTYPEFSKTYYETVCTGAIDGDTGRLIRIYPLTLRHMKEPFSVYDWIEAEVERNTADFRPESFKIKQDTVKKVGEIDVRKREGWEERRKWVLGENNVFKSVLALQQAELADHTSLGLVRPREIRKIFVRKKSDDERAEWNEHRAHALAQRDLFVDPDTETKDLVFVPVRYCVRFVCDDPECTTEHNFSILDWGTYVLSRKVFAEKGPVGAEKDVIAKLEQLLDETKRDGYLFLGNTKAHSQNFSIVGLFTPPKQEAKKRDSQTSMGF